MPPSLLRQISPPASLKPLIQALSVYANYKIDIDTYLVFSTTLSVFLTILLTRKGVDVFLGYPIVLINTVVLVRQNRLIIHRNHLLIILAAFFISLVASANSSTPAAAILAQITGITIFSVYFFSMLVNSGIPLARWARIYANIALWVAVIGLITYVFRKMHLLPVTQETRLRSFYAEPSLFVYATLPAFGLYFNTWLRHRTHKLEIALFGMSYGLAGSSLGYFGILLMVSFSVLPKLRFWKMLLLIAAGAVAMVGTFFISTNFRMRLIDLTLAITQNDISNTNSTTFAILSNAYVSFRTFLSHPFFGVGIGGYQYEYAKYVPFLGNNLQDATLVTLNMYDANSLILRIIAEMGSIGLLALTCFVVLCGVVKGPLHVSIRNAILPYILIRMSRFGAWFSLELYFFVGIYFLNYLQSRANYGLTMLTVNGIEKNRLVHQRKDQ